MSNFSTVSHLRRCSPRNGESWAWTISCEAAFLKLNMKLCSDCVLVPFDPNFLAILTIDASPKVIIAVLSHSVEETETDTIRIMFVY